MDEILLTIDDNNSELDVDLGDIIKIILPEAAGTGYTWDFDGQIPTAIDLQLSEYKMTYKKTLGGSGKRVIEFKLIEKGVVHINLKYWQEWNGDDSIDNRFETKLNVE